MAKLGGTVINMTCRNKWNELEEAKFAHAIRSARLSLNWAHVRKVLFQECPDMFNCDEDRAFFNEMSEQIKSQ